MINSLELYIYVDGISKRVELFKDEVITLTSGIQNINDISKTFTDYTQSFTVPATPYNNSIFKHWYENSLLDAFDHRTRYNAYIEIDTIPFREGKIQIESAGRKNFQIDNYKITFYGNLTQLKDRFGEDMLSSLDYTPVSHTNSFTEVYNRITTTASYDLRYPLIGASYSYEYGTWNPLYDVTIKPVNWIELAPALKVSKIFEFIQTKYGVTFTGTFLTNYQQFTKLWLYMKNTQKSDSYSLPTTVYFQDGSASFSSIYCFPTGFGGTTDYGTINITPATGFETIAYNLIIYKWNGSTWDTLSTTSCIGNSNTNFLPAVGGGPFYVAVSSYGGLTFTSEYTITYTVLDYYDPYYGWVYSTYTDHVYFGSTQSTSNAISISNFAPEIKVADFFMGIVKMFNLIVNPLSPTTFELIPLEMYYDTGKYIDITQYTMADEMDIERPKLFNKLKFSYQKSVNVLNTKFSEMYAPLRGYDYGDLSYTDTNSNEKQTYDITLPFEDIMWQRAIVGTYSYNFMSAAMLNKDLKPYIPKPVLMYENGLEQLQTGASYSIKFNVVGASSSKYFRFSNEIKSGTASSMIDVMTINWDAELSPWYLDSASESLFHRHYNNYITNLYSLSTRIIKVKALLPLSILTTLKLNDKLIIRDKRYLINSMVTNLMTGLVTFELITDYRVIGQPSSIGN